MPLDVSIRQVLKEVLEVLERVQAVDIGSLDDAVDGGAGLGSFRGVAEQPILAADGEIADGALADVIRERSVAAFQEGLERFFMAQGVLDGFAEFGFRQDVQLDVLKPCEISLELLFFKLETLFFTLFVFVQFWNLFNARAYGSHRSALHLGNCRGFITIGMLIVIGQVIIVELGGQFFNVCPIHILDWLIIIAASSLVMWVGEVLRFRHPG